MNDECCEVLIYNLVFQAVNYEQPLAVYLHGCVSKSHKFNLYFTTDNFA